jgi:hypothetical protein
MAIRPLTVADCDTELTHLWGLLLQENDAYKRVLIREEIDRWLDTRLAVEDTDNMFGGRKHVGSAA